jgi:hypothetical protein
VEVVRVERLRQPLDQSAPLQLGGVAGGVEHPEDRQPPVDVGEQALLQRVGEHRAAAEAQHDVGVEPAWRAASTVASGARNSAAVSSPL